MSRTHHPMTTRTRKIRSRPLSHMHIVLPVAGAVLMFILAFIAVFMAF